jgi:hypothetical protein
MAALNISIVVVPEITHAYQILQITKHAMAMDLTQRVALLTRLDKAIQEAKDELDFYKDGSLCSMSEQIHGEVICQKFLKLLTWIRDGDQKN